MKKDKVQKVFIEQLKSIPIISVAAEKVGISRNTVYRWKKEDPEFKKHMEEALAEGEAFVNDMSESQLLSLIKEKNWSAISFWLKHRHPKFGNKIEINAKIKQEQEELSPEQMLIVQEALKLGELDKSSNIISSKIKNDYGE